MKKGRQLLNHCLRLITVLAGLTIGLLSDDLIPTAEAQLYWMPKFRAKPVKQEPEPEPKADPKVSTDPKPYLPPPAQREPPLPRRPSRPPPPEQPPDRDEDTEAGTVTECVNCRPNKNIEDLKAVVARVKRVNDIKSWKKSKGLVQIPTRGENGNIGPCGTYHYSPGGPADDVNDSYASPEAACAFMSLIQDWKKECPSTRSGCRIQWGDVSHKTIRQYVKGRWPHRSHNDGHCIDIRPLRKGAHEDSAMFINSRSYDGKATKRLIALAKSKGASPILFNDSAAGGQYWDGHNNHLHICFKPNSTTRRTCANYQYDPKVCGTFGGAK
ncbi:MAG: hypothetical protein AB7F86_12485 [Bdellovibrionales bacterium]